MGGDFYITPESDFVIVEAPISQVRYVRRNGALVLQQAYVIRKPTSVIREWRDVPIEDEGGEDGRG